MEILSRICIFAKIESKVKQKKKNVFGLANKGGNLFL